MNRGLLLALASLCVVAAVVLAQTPALKQRTGLPPGIKIPKPGTPGSWLNLKNVYVPGEQLALTDPVSAETADEKTFDPSKIKVFIKKSGASDTWELSPILMSGWTHEIPAPAGSRQTPNVGEDTADMRKFGARALTIACTVPQLPRGTYEAWYERDGVKGPIRNVGIFPKLAYTLQGDLYEDRPLTVTVEVVGPTKLPPRAGTASPPPTADLPAPTPEPGQKVRPADQMPAGSIRLGRQAGLNDRLKLLSTAFTVPITLKSMTTSTGKAVLRLADGRLPATVSSDKTGDADFDFQALDQGTANLEFEAPGFAPLRVAVPIKFRLKMEFSGYFQGFADLHAHFMSHLGFNGSFVGKPYDEDGGLAEALQACGYRHGLGGLVPNLESGDSPTHATGGYPEFDGWPRFTSKSHQQAYYRWIERAYREGNLRLVCMLAVNNELVGEVSSILTPGIPRDRPYDDKKLVDRQIKGIWDMVSFIDGKSGGPGKGWMQIAQSPEDARRIVKEGKLAVVIGIEVDSLGNWRSPDDLKEQSGNDDAKARQLIRAELKRLYNKGVRQIAPIHLTDNAFGGAAVYNKIFTALNKFVTGHYYDVENASATGVRYHVGRDEFPGIVHAMLATFVPKAVAGLGAWKDAVGTGGSTANKRGLTKYGVMMLEEMMNLGMVIDMDHFSQKALAQAMDITEKRAAQPDSKYPFVLSHVAFRDLALDPSDTSEIKQTANESHKTAQDIARLKAAGGMFGIGLVQGNVKTFPGTKVKNDSAGSSKSWAQAYQYAVSKMGTLGVGMGTDINGGPGSPGPRFGSFASEPLHPRTGSRGAARRAQAEAQTDGVRYSDHIVDYRRYRWDEDDGVYDDEERQIWEGLAVAKSGVNPDDADIWYWNRADWDDKEVEYYAEGFRAGNVTRDESSWEKRAAFLAKTNQVPFNNEDSEVFRLLKKTKRIWARWKEMESGPNPPLKRSVAGRRDFDINIDGVAHYGLLADFIQDLKNVGLSQADLNPLMSSAFSYVTMWEKCERMKGK